MRDTIKAARTAGMDVNGGGVHRKSHPGEGQLGEPVCMIKSLIGKSCMWALLRTSEAERLYYYRRRELVSYIDPIQLIVQTRQGTTKGVLGATTRNVARIYHPMMKLVGYRIYTPNRFCFVI